MKPLADHTAPCPCQSGKTYGECCALFHEGKKPETALLLMRSRYAAYALGGVDYLIETTHPASPQYMHNLEDWKERLKQFCIHTKFEGLEILSTHEGETLATVTFSARLTQQGQDCSFTEKSVFEKRDGKWLYRSGQIAEGHQPSLITTHTPRMLPLSYYGDPILRKVAEPVSSFGDDLKMLVDELVETMDACDGIGIAAPQVHHSLQLFIIREPKETRDGNIDFGKPIVFINPEVSNPSEKTWKASEGCLSIPAIHAEVERPMEVTIEYLDLEGQKIKRRVSGWEARMIQHENDHVNGVLFIDHLSEKERKKLEPILNALKNRIHDGTEL